MDIENISWLFKRYIIDKGRCKIIVGGAGCINIHSIIDIIDIAVFGRAEGQIINIIENNCNYNNVWIKQLDPYFENEYAIRQAEQLIEGEVSIGCSNRCYFCQYSWVRKHIGVKHYDPNFKGSWSEDDIRSTKFNRAGRFLTAIDGLSEQTRYLVNKKIKDIDIKNKLMETYDCEREAAINLKIYSIIGFPWESEQTIKSDLVRLGQIFESVDRKIGTKRTRVLIMFLLTPFSPEPMTPMWNLPARIDLNIRQILSGGLRTIYKGIDFEAFILPQINSPYTLAKRVLINRCNKNNAEFVSNFVTNRRLVMLDSKQQYYIIMKNKLVKRICGYQDINPLENLKTYRELKKLPEDYGRNSIM